MGKSQWIAKPLPALKGGLAGAISALFSTRYALFRDETNGTGPVATVSYHPLKDEIIIQAGESRWKVQSTTFGPLKFHHEEREYEIHEKMTGRFAILQGGNLVAEGRCKFRSVQVSVFPKEMEEFLVYLTVGLLVRTLVGELAV